MASQNQKARKMSDRGEIGIGTMIVFIASVLVAAIAAGVLIETSGKLQERSQRTGSEATEQVSSNLKVESIVGKRDSATGGLDDLELYVSLAPGASEFDLAQLRLQISNGTVIKTLSHADDATPDANEFNATEVRDADSSFTSAAPVMTAGDLVKIIVELDTNSAGFAERDEVSLLLIPEVGAPVEAGFVTPNSYGTKTVIALS